MWMLSKRIRKYLNNSWILVFLFFFKLNWVEGVSLLLLRCEVDGGRQGSCQLVAASVDMSILILITARFGLFNFLFLYTYYSFILIQDECNHSVKMEKENTILN